MSLPKTSVTVPGPFNPAEEQQINRPIVIPIEFRLPTMPNFLVVASNPAGVTGTYDVGALTDAQVGEIAAKWITAFGEHARTRRQKLVNVACR